MTPEQRQQQFDNDLREVLSTEKGRRFLWAVIDGHAGAMAVTFRAGKADVTAYLEGRRSVGVDLLVDCQRVSPSDAVHMLSEAFKTREAERLEDEAKRKEQVDGG